MKKLTKLFTLGAITFGFLLGAVQAYANTTPYFSLYLSANPPAINTVPYKFELKTNVGDTITFTRNTIENLVVNNAWNWNLDATKLYCTPYPEFDSPDLRCTVIRSGTSDVSITMFPVYQDGTQSTIESNVITVIVGDQNPLPNLTVDISLDDSNGLAVKHTNGSGTAITTEQGNTYIWIDGKLVWTYTWFTYAPDKKLFMNPWTSSTAYPQALEGKHVVKACIDANDIVKESDEGDNCVTRTLISRTLDNPVAVQSQLPDFTIDNIGLEGVTLTVVVRGGAPVAMPLESEGYTYVWIDNMNAPKWKFSWGPLSHESFLKGYGSSTKYLPQVLSEGKHTIKACVDALNNVEESHEENNCKTATVSVGTSTVIQPQTYNPEVMGCMSPLVPYEGTCTDPIPACINPPAHFLPSSCIDKIEDGKYTERYNFQCERGYMRVGNQCKATTQNISTNARTEYEDKVVVETVVEVNPFSDTSLSQLGGKAAAHLFNQRIIGGFSDKTFRGKNAVNRAEAAKFLLLTKYESINDISNDGYFSDVKNGEWYTKYVVTAAGLGVINGYSDATFKPANQVNTAEFLKMLTKTFGLTENLPYSYGDVNKSDWFASYAGIAAKYKLFPDRGTKLQPARALTRYEVAIVIYQYLNNRD